MLETALTSDFFIYNLIKNSDKKYINQCNLKFIDKSVPAQESNTIYVANVDLELKDETFNSDNYKVLVNVYIKTKQTDYVEGSRFLRTVAKEIKDTLKHDVTAKRRHAKVRNISYEYGSQYTLKGIHMIIQLNETDSSGDEAEFIRKFELDPIEVEIDYEKDYQR